MKRTYLTISFMCLFCFYFVRNSSLERSRISVHWWTLDNECEIRRFRVHLGKQTKKQWKMSKGVNKKNQNNKMRFQMENTKEYSFLNHPVYIYIDNEILNNVTKKRVIKNYFKWNDFLKSFFFFGQIQIWDEEEEKNMRKSYKKKCLNKLKAAVNHEKLILHITIHHKITCNHLLNKKINKKNQFF